MQADYAVPSLNRISVARDSGSILVAEDDPSVRELVVQILNEQGYKVLAAENGRKALEQCTKHDGQIHVLITDAVMPELNGRELAERARRIRPNLKVLMMSGYVDRAPKEEDTANPSYAFLQKPFVDDSLLDLVEGLWPTVNRASS
jgi:CheY-like chemotaxis protein